MFKKNKDKATPHKQLEGAQTEATTPTPAADAVKSDKEAAGNWFNRLWSRDKNEADDKSAETPSATRPEQPLETGETAMKSAPSAQTSQTPAAAAATSTAAAPEAEVAAAEVVEAVASPPSEQAKQAAEDALKAKEQSAEKGWFDKLKDGLKKSSNAISDGISGIFTKRKLDDDTLEELEDLLITTDLGLGVAARLTSELAKDRFDKEVSGHEIKQALAAEVEKIVTPCASKLEIKATAKPHVVLMVGVNGAGKTTTIGKFAQQFKRSGKKVMLAAGDTFRAAAVEQLQVWGARADAPVVTKELGSDAAALAYEAIDRAIAEEVDILFIDTAGRLQNRKELMAELEKVIRVIEKRLPGAPHDTVIVLDATTGQNAVHQVDVFQQSAKLTGMVMTKLDGSARGGILVACADKFALPVFAIGIGEAIDDLDSFNPKDFARALIGIDA